MCPEHHRDVMWAGVSFDEGDETSDDEEVKDVGDPRCVLHDLDDDPRCFDLQDEIYKENAITATKRLLSWCERRWQEDVDEGLDQQLDQQNNGTIYSGSCGHALLLYKLALIQRKISPSDAETLDAFSTFGRSTQTLLQDALRHVRHASATLHVGRVDMEGQVTDTPRNELKLSFLESEAGVHAVRGAIHFELGDGDAARNCVERLVSLTSRVKNAPADLCDLLYGRAGFLHTLLFARQRCFNNDAERETHLPFSLFTEIADQIITAGLRGADNEPFDSKFKSGFVFNWKGKKSLGAAHGVCGILMSLMQCEVVFSEKALMARTIRVCAL